MVRRIIYVLMVAAAVFAAAGRVAAQSNDRKIAEQRRVIANLEKKIAEDEKRIKRLKNDKSTTQERVRLLTRQISTRNDLLEANQKQIRLLNGEISRTDSTAQRLSSELDREKGRYAEMVRESYRNYRHGNYLTYLFSSGDFLDMSRRIVLLREVAAQRGEKIEQIRRLNEEVTQTLDTLTRRRASLDSVKRNLSAQKQRLQRDAQTARNTVKRLSSQEQQTLRNKLAREEQLSVAISELRKMTQGNREGASFSRKTSNLRLPVVGGTVRRYKGNMAEIVGPKDAAIISIYEGKVLEIKRNRITNKYDVYIAHGQYISSYANLSDVDVAKGAKVARNQRIGTIGSSVNLNTMEMEYKMVFGIYAPTPDVKLKASDCFRK